MAETFTGATPIAPTRDAVLSALTALAMQADGNQVDDRGVVDLPAMEANYSTATAIITAVDACAPDQFRVGEAPRVRALARMVATGCSQAGLIRRVEQHDAFVDGLTYDGARAVLLVEAARNRGPHRIGWLAQRTAQLVALQPAMVMERTGLSTVVDQAHLAVTTALESGGPVELDPQAVVTAAATVACVHLGILPGNTHHISGDTITTGHALRLHARIVGRRPELAPSWASLLLATHNAARAGRGQNAATSRPDLDAILERIPAVTDTSGGRAIRLQHIVGLLRYDPTGPHSQLSARAAANPAFYRARVPDLVWETLSTLQNGPNTGESLDVWQERAKLLALTLYAIVRSLPSATATTPPTPAENRSALADAKAVLSQCQDHIDAAEPLARLYARMQRLAAKGSTIDGARMLTILDRIDKSGPGQVAPAAQVLHKLGTPDNPVVSHSSFAGSGAALVQVLLDHHWQPRSSTPGVTELQAPGDGNVRVQIKSNGALGVARAPRAVFAAGVAALATTTGRAGATTPPNPDLTDLSGGIGIASAGTDPVEFAGPEGL